MKDNPDPRGLEERFGVPGLVTFEAGRGGLTRARLTAPAASATLYTQGAHLTDFRPTDGEPLLFLSRLTRYEEGTPIRGGVPICFPWFGARASDPTAPSHGLARTTTWEVEGSAATARGVELTLTRTFERLAARYRVEIGAQLRMSFEVTNQGEAPLTYELALHSYFAVGDVREVEVTGLEGASYLDQLLGRERIVGGETPLRFSGETDRIYLNTGPRKTLVDPAWGRQLVIETTFAPTMVVWNPWTEKTARMSDLADDQWPGMLCLETGQVADDAVTLAPGESRSMTTTISVEPL